MALQCSFNDHFAYLLLLMRRLRFASAASYPFSSMIRSMVAKSEVHVFKRRNSNSFILVLIQFNLTFAPFFFSAAPTRKKIKTKTEQHFSSNVFHMHLCRSCDMFWLQDTHSRPHCKAAFREIYVYISKLCVCICAYTYESRKKKGGISQC